MKNHYKVLILTMALLCQYQFGKCQTKKRSLYDDYKQSYTPYISQFVPSELSSNKEYASDARSRYLKNDAKIKDMQDWLFKLAKATPYFDKITFKKWSDYIDQLSKYQESHVDLENSGHWINIFLLKVQLEANEYFPKVPILYNEQGVLEYKNDNYDLAAELFSICIDMSPDLSKPYLNRAWSYYKIDENDLALKDVNIYIKSTEDIDAYQLRHLINFNIKDYASCIADCTKEIESSPYSSAYFDRGNAKHELNDKLGAIKDFTAAIALKQTDADYYIERGNVFLELKNYKYAMADFKNALKADSTDMTPYLYIAKVKFALLDYKGCIENCNILINHGGKAPNTYLLRGRAYYKMGKKQLACEDWSKSGEDGLAEAYTYIQKYCK
jgi:tetratricopeptide (TPR) repeat protein